MRITKKERVEHKLMGERPFEVLYEVRVMVPKTVWARSFKEAEVAANSLPEITVDEVVRRFSGSEVVLYSVVDVEGTEGGSTY